MPNVRRPRACSLKVFKTELHRPLRIAWFSRIPGPIEPGQSNQIKPNQTGAKKFKVLGSRFKVEKPCPRFSLLGAGRGQWLVVSRQCCMPAMRPSPTQSNQIKPNQTCRSGHWDSAVAAIKRIRRTRSITSAFSAPFGGFGLGLARIKPNQAKSNLLAGGGGLGLGFRL
jgi:hypothetical protein